MLAFRFHLFASAENGNPLWMDYQRVTETGLPILYFLGLRLGSYFSTIGSTYLTVMLLPVRPIYHGTRKHYSVEHVL